MQTRKPKKPILKPTDIIEDYDKSKRPGVVQHESVKSFGLFQKTTERHFAGVARPWITNKTTKYGSKKEFAFKDCGHPSSAIKEKIAYDLLKLCGVTVPKTYLVKDKTGHIVGLTSKMLPGYKDFIYFIGSKINKAARTATHDETIIHDTCSKQSVSSQYLTGDKDKPIIGLFENIPVFVFLMDEDAIGVSYQNIGLIEKDDYCQAVKIDPGNAWISTEDEEAFNVAIQKLVDGEMLNYDFFGRSEIKVFNHASAEQIKEGMQRVANLTDDQIKGAIYNPDLPNVRYWGEEDREATCNIFINRRNTFRVHLKQLEEKEKNTQSMTHYVG